MKARVVPEGEQKFALTYAMLAGTARGLGLLARVPEVMRFRGWPADDKNLASVLAAAVSLKALGAGATLLRRPPGADQCGGAWPASRERLTASQVVDAMDLTHLLEAR